MKKKIKKVVVEMKANVNPFVKKCICTIEELAICFLSNKQ